jgi:hypothetical protein
MKTWLSLTDQAGNTILVQMEKGVVVRKNQTAPGSNIDAMNNKTYSVTQTVDQIAQLLSTIV